MRLVVAARVMSALLGSNVAPADADVIAFITANPGAIGYVGAAPAAGTVKVLAIKD